MLKLKHTTGIKLHKLNQLGNVKLNKRKATCEEQQMTRKNVWAHINNKVISIYYITMIKCTLWQDNGNHED